MMSSISLAQTEWGQGFVEEVGLQDEAINFEACFEMVCDPIRIVRYTSAIKKIKDYYRKYNRPELPMSLEAKMMVVSNIVRNVFKEFDFVGFYYLNSNRSTEEIEIAPYSTIIKTPMPLFKKNQGIVGKCWATEETHIENHIAKKKHHYETYDGRARSELALPCFDLEGKLFGVMFIYSELDNMFEETDIVALEEVINFLDY